MLLTNFSAGELSEELFGRTDLGQYFQGAARIENFDVIPSGGIKKRSGSKRLYTFGFPEGGRIIPFIIDREHCYLIGLFPERGEEIPANVAIYRLSKNENGDEIVEKIAAADNVPFAKTMQEINEVQYAQKFYVMILVHQNYPPIQIIYEEGNFNIEVMPFTTSVKYEGDKKLTEGLVVQYDDTYGADWLRNSAEYPCTVTFFQDRLVLAGTGREKQRLFVSEVGTVFSFSTYKIFLTEERTYITAKGKIEDELQEAGSETVKITLDINEFLKFTQSISGYHIDSPLFDNDTAIISLTGMFLTLSKKPKAIFANPTDITEVSNVAENFEKYKNKPEEIKIDSNYWEVRSPSGNFVWITCYSSEAYVYVGPDYLKFVIRNGVWNSGDSNRAKWDVKEYKYPYDKEDVAKWVIAYPDNEKYPDEEKYGERRTVLDPAYFDAFYKKSLDGFKSLYKNEIDKGRLYNFNVETKHQQIKIKALEIIELSMQYYFESGKYWLYGRGTDIKINMERYAADISQVLIPFYTQKIVQSKMTTPDCGFTFEIASDMSDAIKWLVLNKHLIIGTETAEWIVPASVTATNIHAILNSRYGSDKIPGVSIGDAVVFIQSGKKAIVEYYLPQQDNNFRANNMTLFSKGMLHESPARGFDFGSAPYTRIFICREDNSLVTLLYERSTGTFAWGRITTPGAEITHIAVLPGTDGFDDVFLMVKREDSVYLELMREHDVVFLDSYKRTVPDTWAEDVKGYDTGTAQVVRMAKDETGVDVYETLPAASEPDWSAGGEFYIGYPYTSIIRTLPVLANNKMEKQRITSLTFRFLKSYFPRISSVSGGRIIKTDTVTNLKAPYSGVHKIPFPGTWDEDVQVELVHDGAEPVKILSLNAEVQ